MRDRDESKLWFFDQMHNPEPLYPFDLMMPESWLVSLNQYTTRVWNLPTALGIEHRIVNGYLYLSPNVIDDPAMIAEREPIFARAGPALLRELGRDLRPVGGQGHGLHRAAEGHALRAARRSVSRSTRCSAPAGTTTAFDLLATYSRYLENMHEMAYYHFEMLNLAYGAYLTFLEFCRSHFPAITDDLVARMVAGIDVILYRPDAELRRLAARAVELGRRRGAGAPARSRAGSIAELAHEQGGQAVAGGARGGQGPVVLLLHRLRLLPCQPGLDRRPAAAVRRAADYVRRVERGEDLSRPLDAAPRRARAASPTVTADLLDEDDGGRLRQPAGPVPPGVPVRREPQLLRRALASLDLLQQGRASSARCWSRAGCSTRTTTSSSSTATRCTACSTRRRRGGRSGVPTRSEYTWREEVARRRRSTPRSRRGTRRPPSACPPEKVTEPITVTLFGINTETIDRWLAAQRAAARG